MPKEPRPPKAAILASVKLADVAALLRSIDARLARLEADDDQRAARAAALRKP